MKTAVYRPGTRRVHSLPILYWPDNYTNAHADEQPLFTIDGSNWEQYADHLTEGVMNFESPGPTAQDARVSYTKRDYVFPRLYWGNTRPQCHWRDLWSPTARN